MKFYEVEDTNFLRKIVGWIVDIIVVLYLAWFVIFAFGARIQIAGQSMVPVLNSDDVVFVNRITYQFTNPKRYDVIVFRRDDQKSNVKRIIGLPGEEVQIISGFIYIDGAVLEHEGMLSAVSLAGIAKEPILLGKDEYFVLGDNREASEDSRFDNIGNIKKNQIIGKVWFRIHPFIDLGWIE